MERSIKKMLSETALPRNGLTSFPQNEETYQEKHGCSQTKNFEKYEIFVRKEQMAKNLQFLEWRSKVQFPIAKILFYKILPKKITNQYFFIQIGLQKCSTALANLPKMPLFQIIYLLRESMIGFDILLRRFGSFQIKDQMVVINRAGKCRVWCNVKFQQNNPTKMAKMSQNQFKYQIVKIFWLKSMKSSLIKEFFDQINLIQTIKDSILFLQRFLENKKLMVTSKVIGIGQTFNARINNIVDPSINRTLNSTSAKKVPQFIRKKGENKFTRGLSNEKSCQSLQKSISSKNCEIPRRGVLKKAKSIDEIIGFSNNNANDSKETTFQIIDKFVQKRGIFAQNSKQSSDQATSSTPATPLSANDCFLGEPQNSFSDFEGFFRTNTPKQIPSCIKFRKLSNNSVQKQWKKQWMNKKGQKQPNIKQQERKKTIDQLGFNLNMSVNRFPPRRIQPECKKNEANTPQANLFKRYCQDKTEDDAIKDNGWLKQLSSLSALNLRDTVFSYKDGNDVLDETLTLPHVKLELLGKMGKELRGSLLMNAE